MAKQKAPEKIVTPVEKTEEKAPEKVVTPVEKTEETFEGSYIMKVTHLPWGMNGKNHFYADKKPLITEKVMGKYAKVLKIWLDNDWIKKGSYK